MTRLLLMLSVGLIGVVAEVRAQTAAPGPQAATGFVGTWQGSIVLAPSTFRLGLVVTQSGAAGLSATLVSIDQDGSQIPIQDIAVSGNNLRLNLPTIRGSYTGTLGAGGQEIAGSLMLGMPVPLNFKRVERLDPSPTFEAAENAAVRDLITSYFRAFTVKDYDGLRTIFQAPFTIWSVAAAPNVVATLNEIVMLYRGIRDPLDGTEYASSRAFRMSITPLSATSALVDVHWRREKKDGSVLEEGAEVLTVMKTSNGWRINGNIARSLSQYGKAF